ncbi:hypothetical protein UNDYM_5910 (plasmid) [Undibacterium sp. YM2]|uniref:hypothetical protein n=1 Tax=Undibacterium sp. YM2 TaxID=2058625 RepID=UPI001331CC2D|nr:hypothetical protein [Undibacterium sp. YM2]BBB70163.1 hypothetical protein UNDYM_5910 [Undibacterium sp. YM2]
MHVPTIHDVIKPYQKYPKVIQQSILRVETHPAFSILTKAGKRVLKCLLTRVNQGNGEIPIRARLDLVAEGADVSYKTVQRTMRILKSLTWLSPVSPGRTDWGTFSSFRYQFSADFCSLVKLPTKSKTINQIEDETILSDGTVYIDLSFKEDQLKISLENKGKNPITLPEELREMEKFGIKESGICKLRGLAHTAGYKLEHIWTVARSYCEKFGVNGNRLYLYISKMIQTTSDYEKRALQILRMDEVTTISKVEAPNHTQYRFKNFVGTGVRVRIFDGIAEVIKQNGDMITVSGNALNKLYKDIEDKRLVNQDDSLYCATRPSTTKKQSRDAKSSVLKAPQQYSSVEAPIDTLPISVEANRLLIRQLLKIRR